MKRSRCLLTTTLLFLLLASGPTAAQKDKPLTGAFDPEQVLVNLEQTVKDRDWRRYGDFLAEDFRFIPFDSVPLEHPAVEWDEWGRAREIRFIEELVSPNYGAVLELRNNVLDRGPESNDRAEWDILYSLVTRGQVFRSRAIFVFERVDDLWYLREWIDTTIETDKETESAFSTSGSLRVVLSR